HAESFVEQQENILNEHLEEKLPRNVIISEVRQDNDEVTDEVINEGNGEGSNALT
ncbi:12860_t:CDS:2, partial [Funneliformis geosporum]